MVAFRGFRVSVFPVKHSSVLVTAIERERREEEKKKRKRREGRTRKVEKRNKGEKRMKLGEKLKI
jgi:hypothetical protein